LKTKVIACRMIEDEVLSALAAAGADYEIEWIDESFHAYPKKLRAHVQEALDRTTDADRVLLAFGRCGNMIEDLRAGDFELILPNADDCISLMLYPHRDGKETGVYYLTRGWMRSGANAFCDYGRTAERYGEKAANKIMKRLMDGYHTLSSVETGAYSPEEIEAEGRRLADCINLKYERCPGSTLWLTELFRGDWDESRFLRCGPQETIEAF
jgi:hypothetical protein